MSALLRCGFSDRWYTSGGSVNPSNAAPAQRSSTKTCDNVSIPAFFVAFRRSITKEAYRS
jgi:hypothetical protein